MFIDDVKITLRAGKGGNGIVAFRREKYVPLGGPAGGNGGKGGSIIFVGDEGLTTLLDFRYQKKIVASDGENGMSRNCYGKDGKDLYIRVPVGSVVTDLETNAIIADITKHAEEVIICEGGKGGKGNTALATQRVPAPGYAENGLPGEKKAIRIELKVLADVGLVGFPNVGKSTLISVLSKAKPKIDNYPFTTLVPNLGFVQVKDGRSFVMADLPGLIEGASQGAGLGHQFLKHIERTRVIVHVIDMAAIDGRDPYNDYLIINKELEAYNPSLLLRPQIIVANKMDVLDAEKNLKKFKKKVKDQKIIAISAYTKSNLDELLYEVANNLDEIKVNKFMVDEIIENVVEYKHTPKPESFIITLEDDGVYNITGDVVKRYFDATDFNRDENVRLFAMRLRKLGIEEELVKKGVKFGDTVRIFGYEFEFLE